MNFTIFMCCLTVLLWNLNLVKCELYESYVECDNNNYMLCTSMELPEGYNPYLDALSKLQWMRQKVYGYLEVRTGVHLFYQLYYANGTRRGAVDKPLIIWIQGGPGFAATGVADFAEFGPLDMNFKPRNHTWVKDRNVLLIDQPVGAGFSYATDDSLYVKTDRQMAMDLFKAVKLFMRKHKEFRRTPTYIIGQSYGGKIATRLTTYLNRAIKVKGLKVNLKGLALGGGWVHPRESVLTQPEFLYMIGLIDRGVYLTTKQLAKQLADAIDKKKFFEATPLDELLYNILSEESGINFNNVNTGSPYVALEHLNKKVNLYVKPTLKNVNKSINWEFMSTKVYNYLKPNFLIPNYIFLEKLLNNSNIKIVVYNGNLDLVTPIAGTSNWVHKLRWAGSKGFANAKPKQIDDSRNGFYKEWKQLSLWTVVNAGHWVPEDNPQAMEHVLRYLTTD